MVYHDSGSGRVSPTNRGYDRLRELLQVAVPQSEHLPVIEGNVEPFYVRGVVLHSTALPVQIASTGTRYRDAISAL